MDPSHQDGVGSAVPEPRHVVGLGIQVRDRKTRGVKVSLLMGNSPAERCDEIDVHDRILKINHEDVHRLRAPEVQPKLSCDENSVVELVLTRGQGEVYRVKLAGQRYTRMFESDVYADDNADLSSGSGGDSTPRHGLDDDDDDDIADESHNLTGVVSPFAGENSSPHLEHVPLSPALPSSSVFSSASAGGGEGPRSFSLASQKDLDGSVFDNIVHSHHTHLRAHTHTEHHQNHQSQNHQHPHVAAAGSASATSSSATNTAAGSSSATNPQATLSSATNPPPNAAMAKDTQKQNGQAMSAAAANNADHSRMMGKTTPPATSSQSATNNASAHHHHTSLTHTAISSQAHTHAHDPLDDGSKQAELGDQMWFTLQSVRKTRPLIQCITNFVSMDIVSNGLLAVGASPAMIHCAEEVDEIMPIVRASRGAVFINIGTLSDTWITSFKAAVRAAKEHRVPWVLDPVAVGFTDLRTFAVLDLLDICNPAVIVANEREIVALSSALGEGGDIEGSVMLDDQGAALHTAKLVSLRCRCVVAVLGDVDHVTNGTIVLQVQRPSAMVSSVAAARTLVAALVAAFVAGRPQYQSVLLATAHALAFFSLCCQHAHQVGAGPGSFRMCLLDCLSTIRSPTSQP
eukprot:c7480_g1_i1.p1 GENE.c7480_g1_i1~~c7480_g1_i1.p1  ORF type:complete len:630 (-),score=151.98 c7480_g1_i1:49-1938(-)